jgi:hypothetical protein
MLKRKAIYFLKYLQRFGNGPQNFVAAFLSCKSRTRNDVGLFKALAGVQYGMFGFFLH